MNFKTIFFNEFGRVRSGWRFTIFMLSFFLTSIVLMSLGVSILSALPLGFTPFSLESFVLQFSIAFAVAVFYGWLYGKIFEELPFRALGFGLTKNWF